MIFPFTFTHYLSDAERIPETFRPQFQAITTRANALLVGCTESRLEECSYAIQMMLSEVNPLTGGESETEDAATSRPLSLAVALFEVQLAYPHERAGDLSWAQHFALLALMLRDQAWFLESTSKGENFPEELRALVPSTVGSYAVDAMGAVCYADSLLHSASVVGQKVRSALSERNARAAKIRHAKRDALKQEFIRYFYAGQFKIKAEAARRFYRDNKSRFGTQSEEQAKRMLLTALSAFEKSASSS